MSKKKKQADAGVENVDRALSNAEQFIEDNQKSITTILLIILAIGASIIGMKKWYLEPREDEAQQQIFYAQKYFQADSFNLALYGDMNNLGFEEVVSSYSMTKTGNLAKYYAGICELRLGNYEEAIDYLKSYKKKDELLKSVALGAIGDAYVEMEKIEEGLSYYLKAASVKSNDFTVPVYLMKAGLVYESLEETEKAFECYQRIKKEFPTSEQARNIDKYIARAEARLIQ